MTISASTMAVFMSVWGSSAIDGWIAGGRYVPSTSSPLFFTTLSWNWVFSSTYICRAGGRAAAGAAGAGASTAGPGPARGGAPSARKRAAAPGLASPRPSRRLPLLYGAVKRCFDDYAVAWGQQVEAWGRGWPRGAICRAPHAPGPLQLTDHFRAFSPPVVWLTLNSLGGLYTLKSRSLQTIFAA
jgi:hypothetical protein